MSRALAILVSLLLIRGLIHPALAINCEELARRLEAPLQEATAAQDLKRAKRLERLFARAQAKSERALWDDLYSFRDSADLERALTSGQITLAQDRPGIGISKNMSLPYSTPAIDHALDQLWLEFQNELQDRGLSSEGKKLVITSMVRTEAHQKELIHRGFPAAVRSSHTHGIAFDISYQWFEQNAAEYGDALRDVLVRWYQMGRINLIREPLQKVWHIALKKNFMNGLLATRLVRTTLRPISAAPPIPRAGERNHPAEAPQ